MGQYYEAILKFKNGIFMKIEPKGGAKLTEHSYTENDFVLRVCDLIQTNGATNLAWIGDYSKIDDSEDELTREMINKSINNKFFSLVEIFDMSCSEFVKRKVLKISENLKKNEYTIINATTGEFINMKDYVFHNQEKDYILHPLPLLTAIGNGRGGGDYYGENEKLIGSWAGNKFYILDNSKLKILKEDDGLFTLEFFSEYHQNIILLKGFKDISLKINFVEY